MHVAGVLYPEVKANTHSEFGSQERVNDVHPSHNQQCDLISSN